LGDDVRCGFGLYGLEATAGLMEPRFGSNKFQSHVTHLTISVVFVFSIFFSTQMIGPGRSRTRPTTRKGLTPVELTNKVEAIMGSWLGWLSLVTMLKPEMAQIEYTSQCQLNYKVSGDGGPSQ
jgi:hypothetical protein